MKRHQNTVLITGGGSGIGFALAEHFLQADSHVIICGRHEDKLRDAQSKYPQLQIRVCDVGIPSERKSLYDWVTTTNPELNVLINNAGIQKRIDLSDRPAWDEMNEELTVNLAAPIHLATLFVPHLMKQERSAVINVTSGLAFVPLANVPIYCATKAAMRSFTLSLRHQLSGTPIDVIEIIPPAVDTDLGGKGLHTFGVPVSEFADAVIEQLEEGRLEATYGLSSELRRANREQLEAAFEQLNPSQR